MGGRERKLQNDGEWKDAREKLHTLKRTQQHKTIYPKKTQETDTMQISIAQLCHTLTKTQTLQPAVHQTYKIFSWMEPVLMQKDKTKTHCHQMKKILKHKYKSPQKRKQYKHRQTTEQRMEQMHQYRARKPEEITLHNYAQRLPIAR